jgi:tRNA(Ile)-lysidine synthase
LAPNIGGHYAGIKQTCRLLLYIHGMKSPDPASLIEKNVLEWMERHDMVAEGKPVVIGVSGGMDSIALLDVLSSLGDQLRLDLHIAHLNHGLRGHDSDEDARWVEQIANERGLPYHTRTVDCRAISRQTGQTIEETSRDQRQLFMTEVAEKTGAARIATAHHRDDQAETVLLRLLRGTGTTGLAGIRPVRDDRWIRPFLNVTRQQIEEYARFRDLSWRVDQSNFDLTIPRNRIRHDLLPLLEQDYRTGASEALARAAEILQADDELLDTITLDASKTVICADSERKIALDGARFFGYHVAVQRRLIRHFLSLAGLDPRRVSYGLIDRLVTRFSQGPGTVQVSSDLTASYTGRLILLGAKAPAFEEHIGFGSNTIQAIDAHLDVDDVLRPEYPTRFTAITPFEAWFDSGLLPKNLVLRTIRPGDRIRPFGLNGSAKVSDVLIDRKVPRLLRDEVPVLAGPDEVFWIVGVRASETTRIPKSSNNAVRFRFNGSWRRLYSATQQHT